MLFPSVWSCAVTVRDDSVREKERQDHPIYPVMSGHSPVIAPTVPPEWNTIFYRRVHRDALLQPSIYSQLRAWVRETEEAPSTTSIDPSSMRVIPAAVLIPPSVDDLRNAFLQQLQRRKSKGLSAKKTVRTSTA
jgi:hypothetical protein